MATKTATTKTPSKKTVATSTKKPTAKKPASKKDQTIKIVKRMQGRKNVPARGEILDEIVKKVPGMTRNCAATYFQNISSKKSGWE